MWKEIYEQVLAALWEQRELIFRLAMACILGSSIGFERKHRHKGAGMRTHALVCMGAALMMIVSKYGFGDQPGTDGSRIAAQVVSGIGFLGAGVIYVRNNAVNGLTTAAGLWVTAGVGLSIGAGQWIISTIAALIMILLQLILHNIKILAREPYRAGVKIELDGSEAAVRSVENIFQKENINIKAMVMRKRTSGRIELDTELVFPAGYEKAEILNKLIELDAVVRVDI